jgi:hypothetical protein
MKMIDRIVGYEDARRENGKVYVTDQGKQNWKNSAAYAAEQAS